MSFFQQVYEFRQLFLDIEKLPIKCVHLKCATEYIISGILPICIATTCYSKNKND